MLDLLENIDEAHPDSVRSEPAFKRLNELGSSDPWTGTIRDQALFRTVDSHGRSRRGSPRQRGRGLVPTAGDPPVRPALHYSAFDSIIALRLSTSR